MAISPFTRFAPFPDEELYRFFEGKRQREIESTMMAYKMFEPFTELPSRPIRQDKELLNSIVLNSIKNSMGILKKYNNDITKAFPEMELERIKLANNPDIALITEKAKEYDIATKLKMQNDLEHPGKTYYDDLTIFTTPIKDEQGNYNKIGFSSFLAPEWEQIAKGVTAGLVPTITARRELPTDKDQKGQGWYEIQESRINPSQWEQATGIDNMDVVLKQYPEIVREYLYIDPNASEEDIKRYASKQIQRATKAMTLPTQLRRDWIWDRFAEIRYAHSFDKPEELELPNLRTPVSAPAEKSIPYTYEDIVKRRSTDIASLKELQQKRDVLKKKQGDDADTSSIDGEISILLKKIKKETEIENDINKTIVENNPDLNIKLDKDGSIINRDGRTFLEILDQEGPDGIINYIARGMDYKKYKRLFDEELKKRRGEQVVPQTEYLLEIKIKRGQKGADEFALDAMQDINDYPENYVWANENVDAEMRDTSTKVNKALKERTAVFEPQHIGIDKNTGKYFIRGSIKKMDEQGNIGGIYENYENVKVYIETNKLLHNRLSSLQKDIIAINQIVVDEFNKQLILDEEFMIPNIYSKNSIYFIKPMMKEGKTTYTLLDNKHKPMYENENLYAIVERMVTFDYKLYLEEQNK